MVLHESVFVVYARFMKSDNNVIILQQNYACCNSISICNASDLHVKCIKSVA